MVPFLLTTIFTHVIMQKIQEVMWMKVICSKEEKERMIKGKCPKSVSKEFPTISDKCGDVDSCCTECWNKYIDWEITDND